MATNCCALWSEGFWNMASAIGTVLAAVVALGIALSGGFLRMRDRRATEKWALIAASPHLGRCRATLFSISMSRTITTESLEDRDFETLRADGALLGECASNLDSYAFSLASKYSFRVNSAIAVSRHISTQIGRATDPDSKFGQVFLMLSLRKLIAAQAKVAMNMLEPACAASEQALKKHTGLSPYEDGDPKALGEP